MNSWIVELLNNHKQYRMYKKDFTDRGLPGDKQGIRSPKINSVNKNTDSKNRNYYCDARYRLTIPI